MLVVGPVLFAVLAAIFCVILLARPAITHSREGKILAFFALFIFPVIALALGTEAHVERSKQTKFCLTCHVMKDYGRSLLVDNKGCSRRPTTSTRVSLGRKRRANNWMQRN